MDLVLTPTKTGSRIHRATCRRQGTSVSLDDATDAQIREAVAATCCKPKLDALTELAPVEVQLTTPEEPDGLLDAEPEPEPEPEPTPEPEPQPEPEQKHWLAEGWEKAHSAAATEPVGTVQLHFPGKDYFWSSLGKYAIQEITSSLQVEASFDTPTRTLTMNGALAEQAAVEIGKLWDNARVGLNAWFAYKAEHKPAGSYRRVFQQHFAYGWVDGMAGTVAQRKPSLTGEPGYVAGVAAAHELATA